MQDYIATRVISARHTRGSIPAVATGATGVSFTAELRSANGLSYVPRSGATGDSWFADISVASEHTGHSGTAKLRGADSFDLLPDSEPAGNTGLTYTPKITRTAGDARASWMTDRLRR